MASLPPPPSADTANLNIPRTTTIASPNRSSFGAALTPTDLLTGEPAPPPPADEARPPPSPAVSESIRFKAFPYSGVNDYYINCETGFLSMGAGDGHYGLWLDDSLGRGRSGRSQTFGNEPLSDEGEKFGILGVELWVLGA